MSQFLARDVLLAPPQEPKVVLLDFLTSCSNAAKALSDNNIISAPVIGSGGRFIGMLDEMDLVMFACSKFAVRETDEELIQHQLKELNKPIMDILNISGKQVSETLKAKASLEELVKKFAQPGVRSVVLTNSDNGIEGIVNEAKMLDFILQNKTKLESVWPSFALAIKSKISEQLESKKAFNAEHHRESLMSVDMKKSLLEALQLMWNQKVLGLAVLNEDRRIVGNISASDFQKVHITSSFVKEMQQPIEAFFNLRSQTAPKDFSVAKDSRPVSLFASFSPVTVDVEDSIEKAADLMVRFKIHRLYAVSSKGESGKEIQSEDVMTVAADEKVVGVTTMKDIFATLFKNIQ
eukprot:TRINITY_DN25627_c0_g1_i1.p1 TRINITY_DN25627_c0_g1~~TRINITY_DN25627_c0_g1_i1.p1  ORF type:complete len:350 (+),score=100.36 TRINITY_DN25627_c0_g1_i1:69-1118(+)